MSQTTEFLTYNNDDGKTYQAAAITFPSAKSTVTRFRMAEPFLDNDRMTVNLDVEKVDFKENKYGQLQANVKPKEVDEILERYFRYPTLATAYPKDDVVIHVKEPVWGGNNVTLTWPAMSRGSSDLKPIRATSKGKLVRMSPKDLMEKMRKGKVKSLDFEHCWYAYHAEGENKRISISHRFELVSVQFD